MLIITRKDLLLTISDNVIPAMGSSDVPVKFVNDTETYVGFLIEPRAGYYVNGCPKSTVCEYDTSSNIIKIPAEAFKNKGILVIAIALIDNVDSNHIEVTKELALEVTPAPNGTVILPATETWQTAVNNLVEQLYNQDYKPQFDEIEENLHNLVKEAQNQQSKANNQQTQIDNAIDVMGDYEIVQDNPTQIRFKKGDGTYGDTVNLGDNLASKSMVNAGYDTYSGNSYSGSASDYGIEIGKASGAYEQEGTPTPESPIEPKFFEPKHVNTNGGNLFDASKIPTKSQGGATVTNNGDGSLTVSGSGQLSTPNVVSSRYYKGEIPLKAGKLTLKLGAVTLPYAYVVLYYSDSTLYKSMTCNNVSEMSIDVEESFINSDGWFMTFGITSATGQTIKTGTIKPMLYQDEDGTWYPFNADSTPLSLTLRALPDGIKDTYENGVVIRRVGVLTFDGSEDEAWGSWDLSGANSIYRFVITFSNAVKYNKGNNCLSNRFKYMKGNGDNEHFRFSSSSSTTNQFVIFINKSRLEDGKSASLKTWLKSNPVTVWYELAEPYTEQVDLPVIPSYFPYTNAWHDSEVEASELTWNILARQYGSGQTTIKKDEAVLTELDLNTERTANPTTVKVQLQDSEGKVLYLETSSENIYIQSGRFSGKTVQQVLENSIQAISATDEYIEVDVPDSMTQSIDEEFLVDEVDESETETE